MNYRKITRSDFPFIKDRLTIKDIFFNEINFDLSFICISDDDEIICYILVSDNEDGIPKLLKNTDAYRYKVIDIYMKDNHEHDLSKTSYFMIKAMNRFAYIWCDYNVDIPKHIIKATFLDEAKDKENNNHFYFINTLFAGTLNEENS